MDAVTILRLVGGVIGCVVGAMLANWSWNRWDRKRRAPFRSPVHCKKLDILDYEVTLADGRVFIGSASCWYDKRTGRWLEWPGWSELSQYVRRERHK